MIDPGLLLLFGLVVSPLVGAALVELVRSALTRSAGPAEPTPAPAEAAEQRERKPEAKPAPAPKAPPRASLRARLSRTQDALVGRLSTLVGGRTVDAELLDELEELLFTADLGVQTAKGLLETVRKETSGKDAASVRRVLADAIFEKLARVEPDSTLETRGRPHVILVLGVKGSGKTTTIGKLAGRYREAGKKVLLGAGDTFRAAAIEQLQVWGERVGC
ncbi:MAG: signal recognition particle receptor subunit alpha, partial [Proteobacteria bacterium]|nr:signal recognition particle receptor subunit alpha [Pseudomonadota bacterium]